MKTQEPPRSSKGKGKAGESAPKDKSPMERFRNVAKSALNVDPQKVREVEKRKKR